MSYLLSRGRTYNGGVVDMAGLAEDVAGGLLTNTGDVPLGLVPAAVGEGADGENGQDSEELHGDGWLFVGYYEGV